MSLENNFKEGWIVNSKKKPKIDQIFKKILNMNFYAFYLLRLGIFLYFDMQLFLNEKKINAVYV